MRKRKLGTGGLDVAALGFGISRGGLRMIQDNHEEACRQNCSQEAKTGPGASKANPVQSQPIRPIQEDGPNLSPRFAL